MTSQFGCAECYGEDAVTTLEYTRKHFTTTHRLITDSHYGVSVRECRKCGQQFVAIFTEFVDWSGGDDAQYFDIVPVTPQEAAEAITAGEDVTTRFLGNLGTGRKRLVSHWPTGGPHRILWAHGPFYVVEGH
jgi:hypothetical protein